MESFHDIYSQYLHTKLPKKNNKKCRGNTQIRVKDHFLFPFQNMQPKTIMFQRYFKYIEYLQTSSLKSMLHRLSISIQCSLYFSNVGPKSIKLSADFHRLFTFIDFLFLLTIYMLFIKSYFNIDTHSYQIKILQFLYHEAKLNIFRYRKVRIVLNPNHNKVKRN